MSTNLIEVNFRNDVVYAIKQDNEVFVALKPICENLGLDWSSQLRNIKADEILSSTMVVMPTVAEDGKKREMVALPLTFLNGWLFKVETSRIQNEDVKQRVIEYQKECYKVLNNHFNKQVQPPKLPTAIELAQMVIQAEQEKQRLQLELQEKDNVIETHEQIFKDLTDTKDLMGFRMLSKTLQIPEKNLRALLIENKIVYYLEGDMVAHSHGKERGFCLMKKELDRLGKDRDCVKFTKKGQEQILKLWSNQKQNTRVIFMKDYAVYK